MPHPYDEPLATEFVSSRTTPPRNCKAVMRTLVAALFLLAISPQLFAADATKAWKSLLEQCAKSDLIGRHQLFFGLSNAAGAGSVWSFADDRSLRLQWELSDLIPAKARRDKVVLPGKPVRCNSDRTFDWSLSLGLPFSIGNSIGADIAAVLGMARKVTLSITSYSVDMVKFGPFEADMNDPKIFAVKLKEGDMIAANSVKVEGFRAVYLFKNALSSEIQAKFKNRTLTIGSSGTRINSTTGEVPSQVIHASNSTSGSSSSAAPSAVSAGSRSSSTAAESCDVPGTGIGAATPQGEGSAMSGAVTLRVSLVDAHELMLCSQEAPYVIAAYSRVKSNGELGIGPSGQLTLVNATLPKDTRPVPYK